MAENSAEPRRHTTHASASTSSLHQKQQHAPKASQLRKQSSAVAPAAGVEAAERASRRQSQATPRRTQDRFSQHQRASSRQQKYSSEAGGDAGRAKTVRGGAVTEHQLAADLGISLTDYKFPELRDANGKDATPVAQIPLNELTAWAMRNNEILAAPRDAIVEIAEKMAADAGFPEDSNKKFWRNLMANVSRRANKPPSTTNVADDRLEWSASATASSTRPMQGSVSDDLDLPHHPLVACMDSSLARKIPEDELQEMLDFPLRIKEFADFFAHLPGFAPFIPARTTPLSEIAKRLADPDVDGPVISLTDLYENKPLPKVPNDSHPGLVVDEKERALNEVLGWHKQIGTTTDGNEKRVFLTFDGPHIHADFHATHLPSSAGNSRDGEQARAYHERLKSRPADYWAAECHDSSCNTDALYLRDKMTETVQISMQDMAVERTSREQWDTKRRLTVALDALEQRSQGRDLPHAQKVSGGARNFQASPGDGANDTANNNDSASSSDDEDHAALAEQQAQRFTNKGMSTTSVGETTIDPIDLGYFDRKVMKYWTVEMEENFKTELRSWYSEETIEKLLPVRKSSKTNGAPGSTNEDDSKPGLVAIAANPADVTTTAPDGKHKNIQLGPLRKHARTVFRLKWHATALQRFLMFRKYQREILWCSQAAARNKSNKAANNKEKCDILPSVDKRLADKAEQSSSDGNNNPVAGKIHEKGDLLMFDDEQPPMHGFSKAARASSNDDSEKQQQQDRLMGRQPLPSVEIHFVYALVLSRASSYRVSSVKWNAICPNVIAVAYERGTRRFSDPGDSFIAVFSLLMPEFPKRVYFVDRAVTDVEFCPRNPNLLAACTITGEIYLYNIRRRGEQPVSNNRMCSHRHRFNIYALQWTEREKSTAGTVEQERVNVLLSGADDGRVLLWHVEKPELEAEEIMKCRRVPRALGDKKRKKEALLVKHSKPTCIDVHPTDKRVYLIGTDEGWIHKCSVSYSEQYLKTFNGHRGPVTGVAYNKFDADIFASTGEDWNIMVWRDTSVAPIFMLNITELRLGYKQVVWSPFTSTQMMARRLGSVEIWDLALDTLNPYAILRANEMTNQQFTSCTYGPVASLFAVGDTRSKVNLFQLREPTAKKAATTAKHVSSDGDQQQREKLYSVLKEAPSLSLIMGNYYSVD